MVRSIVSGATHPSVMALFCDDGNDYDYDRGNDCGNDHDELC